MGDPYTILDTLIHWKNISSSSLLATDMSTTRVQQLLWRLQALIIN